MMKKKLLALTIGATLTSSLIGPVAHAGLKDLKDILNVGKSLNGAATKDVYSGVKFNYLDKKDRLMIVNDFLSSVELDYVLLPLKKERIGLDFEKLKADAIAAENNAQDFSLSVADRTNSVQRDEIAFQQAKSNMEFLDRMQALVSSFQDTHFSIQETIGRPYQYTGIRLFRVQGKIIVGSLEKKLLGLASKLSNGNDVSGIQIGQEVVSIDGVPVEDKINELKKYVMGSSDEWNDNQAIRSLTIRNFKYDNKNYIKVGFADGSLIKLPLFINNAPGSTNRPDVMTYMNRIGIASDATNIGLNFDKATKTWSDSSFSFSGYNTRTLHLNLKGLTEYTDNDGGIALRTGYFINKGKTYGVMQLLNFTAKTVKIGDAQVPFLDAIRGFVAELKDNQMPMILDLRVNGGGNGNYPGQILGILAGENTIYAGNTSGMRMTEYTRQLNEGDLFQLLPAEDQSIGITIDDINNMVQKTLDAGRDYSPMYAYGPVMTDAKVKGFSNKIVTLVTSDCISACDMMSFMLKTSKRATIIGTHTNGTGAGYRSSSELDSTWSDRLRVLQSHFPNFLFGLPGGAPDQYIFEDNSASRLCTENRPTVADVQYSTTILDVAKNNVGWLLKSAAFLDSQQ